MPYNGSGTFTLSQPAFVPNTVISSSSVNSDLSDIATNGLTNAVTKDGQTTLTGALKGANGSVGLPMYSFAADLNTGMYRAGADTLGFSAGGTQIVSIGTAGVTITGTITVSGVQTFTGQISAAAGILNSNGTVALPSYSFTSDPDSGIYRIGANNLGIGVNATKIIDVSTTGVATTGTLSATGVISTNGTALAPQAQAAGMVNGTIVETHAGNAATFAIKTLAGADPSAGDPVYFVFRNVTAATGNYVVLQATAAMSVVLSSGSTLGLSSGVAGRVWFAVFNDAGTPRLAAINCLSGTNIYALGQLPIASSTAEGGAGGADSAQVFYSTTAVASKAYCVIGYASYETGLATAGAWAASPTRIQLFGDGVPLPGTPFVPVGNSTGAAASGTTLIPNDDTIPQNTEGDQYMSQAITPTSAANVLWVEHKGQYATSANGNAGFCVALFQDSTASALKATGCSMAVDGVTQPFTVTHQMIAGTTSSTTFKIRAGNSSAATTTFNGNGGARKYGGVLDSHLNVTEIMA